ncbi:hypothetical protein [Methylobacterium oxalidis]|uniref:hypothetical protein n=1 Tax=Methylobacterium oxalidis TaxID=944322 RepID=UPI0033154C74
MHAGDLLLRRCEPLLGLLNLLLALLQVSGLRCELLADPAEVVAQLRFLLADLSELISRLLRLLLSLLALAGQSLPVRREEGDGLLKFGPLSRQPLSFGSRSSEVPLCRFHRGASLLLVLFAFRNRLPFRRRFL